MSWVPSCLVCCKKEGKEKATVQARGSLSKEINFVELLKSQRYYKKAFELQLT